MVAWRAAICAIFGFLLGTLQSHAQDVTLISRDGTVEVSGNLLSFDGEFYRVETDYGRLTLDGTGVRCTGPGCPDLTQIIAEVRLTGSPALAEKLIPALLSGFADRHGYSVLAQELSPEVTRFRLTENETGRPVAAFLITAARSADAFAALIREETDIALSSLPPTDDILALAAENGFADLTAARRYRVIALDALVPVVSPDSPLRQIDQETLSAIFGNQVSNWEEISNFSGPIRVESPPEGSDLLDQTGSAFPGFRASDMHADVEQMITTIADDPFAIGLARFSERGLTIPLMLQGACGMGYQATGESLKTEEYPFSQPQFMYFSGRRLPKTVREFLRYIASEDAQQIIRQAGFVDQSVGEIPFAAHGVRLANAIKRSDEEVTIDDLKEVIETLETAHRLTLGFRFQPGSSELDFQSRSNVDILADLLESGKFDGKELLFVGFSDGDGSAVANQRISLDRARAVYASVQEALELPNLDGFEMSPISFGERMPIACDDSDWGRQVNRRVEIWIRPLSEF